MIADATWRCLLGAPAYNIGKQLLMVFGKMFIVLSFTAFYHLERIRFAFAWSGLGFADPCNLGHGFLGWLNLGSRAARTMCRLLLH